MIRKIICLCLMASLTACGGGGDGASPDTSVNVPTGVMALATSDTKVSVSWTPVAHAVSYVVYYSTTSPVTKSSIKSSPISSGYAGINFYGAASGTTYYFAVAASPNVDGSGDTDLSTEVSATTYPSSSSITVMPGDGQAQVTWNVASGTTYKIYHSPSNNFTKFNGLATVEPNVASPFTVSSLVNGQVHYFAATATVGGVEGALSAIQAVVPNGALASGVASATPQGFTVDCFFKTQPTFHWAKQAGATGYRIYHSVSDPVTVNDAYYAITSNDNTYTLFPFGTALSGTNYFVMTALNGTAQSAPSLQISCP